MGSAAAHDADVAADGDDRQATALEDLEVRPVMGPVLDVEAGLVGVEAVGVLHGELAGADHPGTRARVVTPLDLDLEDQLGQLAVGADLARGEARHHLLVGHGEHHLPVAPVPQPGQLGADLLVPPTLLPQLGRVHDRERDLHAADGGELLAQYLLYVHHRPPAEGQVGEHTLAELAHVAGAEQELVTRRLDPGGRLPQRLTEQPRHPHRESPPQ